MPEMTTPVHADPRRSGAPAGLGFAEPAIGTGSALEMPVLFQLSDLSQAKVLSPPARPKHQHHPTAKPSVSEPVAAVSANTELADPLPVAEVNPAPDKAAATPVPAVLGAADGANVEPPLLAAAVSATEPSVPAPSDSPTIRERAQLRERRRQAATQTDWFQSQGKYILVVFLVLLVGTIYVARRGGDDSPPSPTIDPADLATETPLLHSNDESQLEPPQLPAKSSDGAPTELIADAPAIHSTDSPLPETSPAGAFPAEESPAATFDEYPAVDSTPQVTLQAPVQDEPAQNATADGSLFPWATQPEPRVATRPVGESQDSSVPLPQSNPHFQTRPYGPGAVGTAPQQPANAPPAVYPSTGIEGATLPEASIPADAATPAVYPVVDPALPRSSSMKPPRGAATSATMPASYENRIPTAPSTSGPRYERTGSGLY
jgi:hypothetical protein